MLDFDKVNGLFMLFSDMTAEGAGRWESFCQTAISQVEARLRPGADTAKPEHLELLHSAAAAWAYCDYLMVASAAGGGDEIRVGDISMKTAGSSNPSDNQDALEIREYFLGQAAHLLLPPCPALVPAGGGE